MKKCLLPFFLFITVLLTVTAQDAPTPESELNILRLEDQSWGYRLHSRGWGVFYDYSKQLTYYKRKVYQFEIAEYKHPKQNKQIGLLDQKVGQAPPRPYVYGKQNNFYLLRAMLGRRKQLGEKAEKGGIEIWNTFMIGPSLGILKPYYLNYDNGLDDGPAISRIKYTGDNEDQFLNEHSIYGSAGFYRGFFESKIIPGIHTKYGYYFDWAPYKDMIRALEVGATADVYFRNAPLMVLEENSFFFFSVYVSLQLGKRW